LVKFLTKKYNNLINNQIII